MAQLPGQEPITLKSGEPVVTLTGEPGEIVLWLSGRDACRSSSTATRCDRTVTRPQARRLPLRSPTGRASTAGSVGVAGSWPTGTRGAGRFPDMTTLIAGPSGRPGRPFGTVLAAMVTPFTATGELDVQATGLLAERLVDEGNNGLVVNGTTGESPTTTRRREGTGHPGGRRRGRRPGHRRRRGRHLRHRALGPAGQGGGKGRGARRPGRHPVLLPAPAGGSAGPLRRRRGRLRPARDACTTSRRGPWWRSPRRPCSGSPSTPGSPRSRTPRATCYAGSQVIAGSDLAYYSGDDPLTLPWMSVGGVGIVSIIAHVRRRRTCGRWWTRPRPATTPRPASCTYDLLPAHRAMGRCGGGAGLVFAKAALRLRGFGVGDPRLPQIPATHQQTEQIARDLDEIGPLL